MTDVTPSTRVDFGPLAGLIGTWKGDKGLDRSPEPDGTEENLYYETITFEPVGDVANAERQKLVVIRYLQVVYRKSDDKAFHDETGYWIWDAESKTVMHSLTIPRGVCVLAGGQALCSESPDEVTLEVAAGVDDPDWGIVQSPFMRENARTVEFQHTVRLAGDTLFYSETTVLEIYDRMFEHTDENELTRA